MANKKYSRQYWQGIGVAFIVLTMGQAAFGATINWTDWTSATIGHPGSAAGTISTVGVTYAGELAFAQTSGAGTNYWVPSAPYGPPTLNAPPGTDIIALDLASTGNTITFTQPLLNPVMAIVSLGAKYPNPGPANVTVYYTFDQAFNVIDEGLGYWGTGGFQEQAGNVLRGTEGHGLIQFIGTYSSISWDSTPNEYWHGFTVGVEHVPQPVPEPGTMMLLGSGLVGLAGWGRKKFRK